MRNIQITGFWTMSYIATNAAWKPFIVLFKTLYYWKVNEMLKNETQAKIAEFLDKYYMDEENPIW